jgi:hypothetical protein
MGYSAQVQQSPNQSSGKGNFQQFRDLMGQPSTAGDTVAQANTNPYQGTRRIIPQGNQSPIDNQGPIPVDYAGPENGQPQMTDSGINSGAPRQAMGKGGGTITNSATSGQPRIGQPNAYPNTVGMGDNSQQQQQPQMGGGKGKV